MMAEAQGRTNYAQVLPGRAEASRLGVRDGLRRGTRRTTPPPVGLPADDRAAEEQHRAQRSRLSGESPLITASAAGTLPTRFSPFEWMSQPCDEKRSPESGFMSSPRQPKPTPSAGVRWSSLPEIRLPAPPTTLRRLQSVPDGRKLDYTLYLGNVALSETARSTTGRLL